MNKHRNLLTPIGLLFALAACTPGGGGGTPVPTDTVAPTVSLASSSTNVTAAGNITLTATATDNVGVTKVEFFDGAAKLGEDTTSGDGFTRIVSLTSANNGSRSYTAKAFDAVGNNTPSAARAVTVNIPTVTDTAGPRLLSATATGNTTVRLVFNEAIVGGNVASNFRITVDLTTNLSVTGASVSSDGTTVTLTTAPQTAGQAYVVLPPTVTDLAGNAFDTAGSGQFVFSFSGFVP